MPMIVLNIQTHENDVLVSSAIDQAIRQHDTRYDSFRTWMCDFWPDSPRVWLEFLNGIDRVVPIMTPSNQNAIQSKGKDQTKGLSLSQVRASRPRVSCQTVHFSTWVSWVATGNYHYIWNKTINALKALTVTSFAQPPGPFYLFLFG